MEKIISTLHHNWIALAKVVGMEKYLLNKKYQQVVKFVIAGATGAIIELVMFYVMINFMNIHYLVANLASITTAITINYIISQKWVFETGRYSQKTEFAAFLAVSAGVVALNQGLVWLFVDFAGMGDMVSKATAIIIVAFVNFVGKKYLVFKG